MKPDSPSAVSKKFFKHSVGRVFFCHANCRAKNVRRIRLTQVFGTFVTYRLLIHIYPTCRYSNSSLVVLYLLVACFVHQLWVESRFVSYTAKPILHLLSVALRKPNLFFTIIWAGDKLLFL